MILKSMATAFLFVLMSSDVLAKDNNSTESPKPTLAFFFQMQDIIRQSYCPNDKQKPVQTELLKMLESDKADRMSQSKDMTENDVKRRARVAVIAAESCLVDKKDFYAASIIYQHGVLPEHYFLAIAYANKFSQLSASEAPSLRQVTIDRYLMSLGKKQLFGSQIVAPVFYKQYENAEDAKPCVWPIDENFDLLNEYEHGTAEYREQLKAQISAKTSQIGVCDFPAQDSKHLLNSLLSLEM